MKTTVLTYMIAVLVSLMALPTANAQAVNLLKNTDFSTGAGKNVPEWKFSIWNLGKDQELAGQVSWGVVEQKDGKKVVAIQTLAATKAHLWWQQRLPVTGSGTYRFTVKVKLVRQGKTTAFPGVGLYFLDPANKWLVFEPVKAPAAFASGEWTEFSGTIVAPEAAASVTARLGLDFNGEMEVFFRDPVLTVAP